MKMSAVIDAGLVHPLLTGVIARESVDWPRVTSVTYRIDQRFAYTYDAPIRNLRHRLVVSPPRRHGAQTRLARELVITPAVAWHSRLDAFGNEVVSAEAAVVEEAFDVRFSALVRTAPSPGTVTGPRVADVFTMGLRTPAGLTAADDAMRETAFAFTRDHRDEEERARAIASFCSRRFTYTKNVTDVTTTAVQAFHLPVGVCQDYAHVALALARSAGLACRYVSGHLLGEGGTHAWIEFLLARGTQTRVLALDPTNDCEAGIRHVVVATGRDYEDVAPTSGTFDAPVGGTFEGRHAVSIARVTYD